MLIFFRWTIWGLPFGFTAKDDEYRWAFSIGPLHFVRTLDGKGDSDG